MRVAESSSETDIFEMSLADARARIEDALNKPTLAPETDTWPLYKALVQWLVDKLPEGGEHRSPAENWESYEELCDTFFATGYPFIDLSSGGSVDGIVKAADRGLAIAGPATKIIPGHGPLMTMRDLEEYAQFSREFRNGVVSGFNHGLSLGEVVESWKVPAGKYSGYTAPPERTTASARAIFGELTRGIGP